MIIGITGKKHHGKDTAAEALNGFTKLAFAVPLKESAIKMFNLSHEQVYSEKLKDIIDPRYNKTPRQLLQWLGSVVRDQFDRDHWTKLMDSMIEAQEAQEAQGIVVTDVRYDNECLILKKRNAIIICIERDLDEFDGHESEKGVSPELIDYVVKNDGTVQDLHLKILDIARTRA